jgi:hypothetical protein
MSIWTALSSLNGYNTELEELARFSMKKPGMKLGGFPSKIVTAIQRYAKPHKCKQGTIPERVNLIDMLFFTYFCLDIPSNIGSKNQVEFENLSTPIECNYHFTKENVDQKQVFNTHDMRMIIDTGKQMYTIQCIDIFLICMLFFSELYTETKIPIHIDSYTMEGKRAWNIDDWYTHNYDTCMNHHRNENQSTPIVLLNQHFTMSIQYIWSNVLKYMTMNAHKYLGDNIPVQECTDSKKLMNRMVKGGLRNHILSVFNEKSKLKRITYFNHLSSSSWSRGEPLKQHLYINAMFNYQPYIKRDHYKNVIVLFPFMYSNESHHKQIFHALFSLANNHGHMKCVQKEQNQWCIEKREHLPSVTYTFSKAMLQEPETIKVEEPEVLIESEDKDPAVVSIDEHTYFTQICHSDPVQFKKFYQYINHFHPDCMNQMCTMNQDFHVSQNQ